MWAVIGAALELVVLLLKRWFSFNDEQKAKAKDILSEIPKEKTPENITRTFDRINRI